MVSTGREILQATTTTVPPPPLTPEEQIAAANDAITKANADLAAATANINTGTQTTAALNNITDALASAASSTAPRSVTTCQGFSDKLKEALGKLTSDDDADSEDAGLSDGNVADALDLIGEILDIAIPCTPSEVDELITDCFNDMVVAKGMLATYITKNEELKMIAEEIIEDSLELINTLNEELIDLGLEPISFTSTECGRCIFPFIYMVCILTDLSSI